MLSSDAVKLFEFSPYDKNRAFVYPNEKMEEWMGWENGNQLAF